MSYSFQSQHFASNVFLSNIFRGQTAPKPVYQTAPTIGGSGAIAFGIGRLKLPKWPPEDMDDDLIGEITSRFTRNDDGSLRPRKKRHPENAFSAREKQERASKQFEQAFQKRDLKELRAQNETLKGELEKARRHHEQLLTQQDQELRRLAFEKSLEISRLEQIIAQLTSAIELLVEADEKNKQEMAKKEATWREEKKELESRISDLEKERATTVVSAVQATDSSTGFLAGFMAAAPWALGSAASIAGTNYLTGRISRRLKNRRKNIRIAGYSIAVILGSVSVYKFLSKLRLPKLDFSRFGDLSSMLASVGL